MNKKFKMDELPPELQTLVDQYIEAKQSLYGYDEETLSKKVSHLYENIRSVTVTSKLTGLVKGYYKPKAKTLTISEATWLNGLDKETFIHELNHAWNTDKNRINILPRKWSAEKKRKYTTLNEMINEAETQILIGKNEPEKETAKVGISAASAIVGNSGGSALDSGLKAPGRFHCYSDVECLFETLVTVSNTTPIEFLKAIDGKDVDGIAEFMAKRTGHTKDRMLEYIDVIAENTYVSKNNKDKKTEERFQAIYDESARLIEESTLLDEIKSENHEKLSCVQDRLILTSGVYRTYIGKEKGEELKKARRLMIGSRRDKEKLETIKEKAEQGELNGPETFLEKARTIIRHPEYSKKLSPFVQPDWGDEGIKKIDIQKSGRILLLDHSIDDRSIFRKIMDRFKSRNVPKMAVAKSVQLKPIAMVEPQMTKLSEINNLEEITNYYESTEQNIAVDGMNMDSKTNEVEEIF